MPRITGFMGCALVALAFGCAARAQAQEQRTQDAAALSAALVKAAGVGDVEQMRSLLQKGADVNLRDATGQTPLFAAARYGKLEAAQLLLDQKADAQPLEKGDRSAVPLYAAALNGHADIIKLLVKHGADVNFKTSSGETAIFAAIKQRRLESLKTLIDLKANVNVYVNNGVGTPLMMATSWTVYNRSRSADNFKIIQLLLAAGADPAFKDQYGGSALKNAAQVGDNGETAKLIQDAINNPSQRTATPQGPFADIPPEAPHNPALIELIRKGRSAEAIAILQKDPSMLKAQDGYGAEPLTLAMREGQLEVAKYCLENGADVNAKDHGAETPLGTAILQGDRDMVALLIQKKADPNLISGRGRFDAGTPLGRASYYNQVEIVKLLLDHGADINGRSGGNTTAQVVAIRRKSPDTALLLIARGADPAIQPEFGESALIAAAVSGDAEVVAALKKASAKESVQDAVVMKDYETLATLLKAKPELANSADAAGRTPLGIAASRGDLKSAGMLLASGADPNAKCQGGTPMALAMQSGDQAMQALLAGKGGKVAAGSTELSEALLAAANHSTPEAVKALLDKGADVNYRGKQRETPLYKAAYFGKTEVVQLLLDYKADVQPRDQETNVPLFGAADQGRVEIIKLLVQHGADVNFKYYGLTAIFGAIRNTRLEAVRTLIALKADVNVWPKGDGRTPLIWAAGAFQAKPDAVAIVKLLLAAGADPAAKDRDGQTPMSRAKAGFNPEIVKLLQEAMKAPPVKSPDTASPNTAKSPADAPAPNPSAP
jgi:ankyrin repeat protein